MTTFERVDDLIQRVMQDHPGNSPRALAKYFEAVHQELAPLARDLEAEVDRLNALIATEPEKAP